MIYLFTYNNQGTHYFYDDGMIHVTNCDSINFCWAWDCNLLYDTKKSEDIIQEKTYIDYTFFLPENLTFEPYPSHNDDCLLSFYETLQKYILLISLDSI